MQHFHAFLIPVLTSENGLISETGAMWKARSTENPLGPGPSDLWPGPCCWVSLGPAFLHVSKVVVTAQRQDL